MTQSGQPHNVADEWNDDWRQRIAALEEDLEGERLQCLYVPLDQARLWDDNPKEHELPLIAASIRKHGFRDPMAYDGTLGAFIEGHGRTAALLAMREAGESAPRGIGVHPALGWCVPVMFGVDAQSREAAMAYGIGHNQLTTVGGYDTAALARVMRTVAETEDDELLRTTGFDKRRQHALVGDVNDLTALMAARQEQSAAQRAADPDIPISPELFERHDYVVFYFDNELDWRRVSEALGLETVISGLVDGKTLRQKGVGRVLDGRRLLALLDKDGSHA